MRKLLTCAVTDVPPLHLNSRNDMSRAYAVRIIASPRAKRFFCVWFVPAVVFTISGFLSDHDLQLVNRALEVCLAL